MINSFVQSPVKVTVGVLLVALFGTIGLTRMPMQLTPEVQVPTLSVETRWPGASPQEVEREIVQEQEEQLKSVEGVVKMTSECMDSMGRIILEFDVGEDMSQALLKVNTRLQQVPSYPENVDEPVIVTSNSGDRPIAWFILKQRAADPADIAAFQEKHPDLKAALEPSRTAGSTGLRLLRLRELAAVEPRVADLLPPDVDLTEYRKFAEDFIEARFERVPGVSNANVLGGREEELQIVIDPQKLAARHLTIQDVRNALRGQNKDTSAGDFWEGKRRYVVRTLGQFRSPEQVREALIARRDGQPVYVKDVAEVRLGFKKPDGIVRNFTTTSIALNALRATGANVLDVMAGLRVAAQELNDGILKQRGLQLIQVYDETEYIYSSIGLVRDNIFVGGALTVAVLLLFLRSVRSTLVIALAIPTSIIGTFLVMNLMGRSLNVISLAGLAFAVGMLVDNAVVVLENIYSQVQRGKPPFRAAVDAAGEVWGAVLSSTLTTLAVFLPILFVQDQAGQLFRDIAIAISAGVSLSLVVALTVIPTAGARLVRSSSAKPESPAFGRNGSHVVEPPRRRGPLAFIDRLGGRFIVGVVGLNRFLQRSWLMRLTLVGVFVFGSLGLSRLLLPKVEYLPNGNQNLVFGILLPPPGYNLDQLLAMGESIEKKTRPYWDVDPKSAETKRLKYPAIRDFFFVARGRMVFLGLRAWDDQRAGELIPLVREVAADLPGTFAVAKQASLFEQGLTSGRTIDVEISGPELEKLVALGGRILGACMGVLPPGTQAIPQPSLDLSSPEMHVIPKWEQSADLGLTAVDIGYAVDALVDGAFAGDYFKDGTRIDLTIVGLDEYASRTQDLPQLPIATPVGELVPLAAVADVKLSSGPEQINRRQRQRAITIQVTPPPDMPLEDALEVIESQIVGPIRDSGELGTAYQINFSGTADKLRSTWDSLKWNFLLALLITYLLMAALFESWIYPFVVILSVPLGMVGGVAALRLLNVFVLSPLDVVTMLGFVILIGTVVNNPILIVEQALLLIRRGTPRGEAILEAVGSRVRPIFMTTMTTVLGLLPLVLFPGAGSELYRGLGAVLLGGLLVSTMVTLVVVPSVFTLTAEAMDMLRRAAGRRGPEVAAEDPSELVAAAEVGGC